MTYKMQARIDELRQEVRRGELALRLLAHVSSEDIYAHNLQGKIKKTLVEKKNELHIMYREFEKRLGFIERLRIIISLGYGQEEFIKQLELQVQAHIDFLNKGKWSIQNGEIMESENELPRCD